MTAKIEIYTTPTCPFCVRAKDLLQKKEASYVEVDVSRAPEIRSAMIERAGGRRTVPQIFINDQHVGGSDDLYALDKKGELDALLNA